MVQENQLSVLPAAQNSQQHVSQAAQDNPNYVLSAEKSVLPADESYDNRQTLPYQPESSQKDDAQYPINKKRGRKFCNRTRTGCRTCRARKKKCDENRPVCDNCQRGSFNCGGYGIKLPGGTKVGAGPSLTAIKPTYEPSHGPSQFQFGPFPENHPIQPQPPSDLSGYVPQTPSSSDPYAFPSIDRCFHPQVPPPAEYCPRDAYTKQYPEMPHYATRCYSYTMSPPSLPAADYAAFAPYRVSPNPSHGSHRYIPPNPCAPCAHPGLPRCGPFDQYNRPSGPPITTNSKNSGTTSHCMEAHGTMRPLQELISANKPRNAMNGHDSHPFPVSYEQRSRDSFEPIPPHMDTLDGYVVQEQAMCHTIASPDGRRSPEALPVPRRASDGEGNASSRSSNSICVPVRIPVHNRNVWSSNQGEQVPTQFIDIGPANGDVASKHTIRLGQNILRMRSLKRMSAVMTNELNSNFNNLPDINALQRSIDCASQRAQHFAEQANVALRQAETYRQHLEQAREVADKISDTKAKIHRTLEDLEAIRASLGID